MSEGPHLALNLIFFVLFYCSLIGWGRWLSKSDQTCYCLLAGAVLSMLLPPILSIFGLLNQPILAIAFTIAPLIFAFRFFSTFKLKLYSRFEKILFASLVLLFVCRFFEASMIRPHGDPFYYDLFSAVRWQQLGAIQFLPSSPLIFQASWWDYLYIWPAMFFKSASTQDLMDIQIFGQWTHLFVAFLGSLMLWTKITSQLKCDKFSQSLSTLAIAACGTLWWSATLAKNDWGCIFLYLGALSLFLDSRFVWGGIILGVCLSSKWTSLPLVMATFLWIAFRHRQFLLKVAAGCTLGIFPIVLRNLWATGNPVFPVPLGPLGRQYVSDSFSAYIQKFSPGIIHQEWSAIIPTRSQIIFESPFLILGAIALAFLSFKRQLRKPLLDLYSMSVVAFVLFSIISGPWAENRLFGPGIVLLVGIGAALVSETAMGKFKWAVLVLALATSRIPTFMPKKFFDEWPPSEAVSRINSGDLKEKIRNELPPGTRILTTGDNEHFYLSAYDIADLPNHPSLDRAVNGAPDIKTALERIHKGGYRYLLHTTRFDGYCWEGLCEKLQANLPQFESMVILRGKSGVLMDLDRRP